MPSKNTMKVIFLPLLCAIRGNIKLSKTITLTPNIKEVITVEIGENILLGKRLSTK